MAFTPETFYSLSCDGEGCKAEVTDSEYGGLLWMADKEALVDHADQYDWRRQDDGRILCWDCRCKPGGDMHEPQEEAV